MKKLLLAIFISVFLGFSVWTFLKDQKEMQKERQREKPIQTQPRTKKDASGSLSVEFDPETLQISGVLTETVNGPLGADAIVTADGGAWYFAEVRSGVFQRKRCVTEVCTVLQEKVVTRGAQMLLSEERKGITQIREEGDGR